MVIPGPIRFTYQFIVESDDLVFQVDQKAHARLSLPFAQQCIVRGIQQILQRYYLLKKMLVPFHGNFHPCRLTV